MTDNPYKRLAERLDALPNGFPPTDDGSELRLLAKLFTPQEAALAAVLRMTPETADQIAARLVEAGQTDVDPKEIGATLKTMIRKGLISGGRTPEGLGFSLMPFVVGIYEAQAGRVDAELARLFEDYYQQSFSQALITAPSFHRVVPIGETIQVDMEVRPYESATDIVKDAQSWGVLACICRTQKELIGDPCDHPVDMCMVFGKRPDAFVDHPVIRSLTQDEALTTLKEAAKAGLVHSVSNSQADISYICNCCTCSCGILRGMAEMGIANVVARSPFLCQVDEDSCYGCQDCLEFCQFDALSMNGDVVQIHQVRCVGCGLCVTACPDDALILVRRPEEEVLPVPASLDEWGVERAQARKIDIRKVM